MLVCLLENCGFIIYMLVGIKRHFVIQIVCIFHYVQNEGGGIKTYLKSVCVYGSNCEFKWSGKYMKMLSLFVHVSVGDVLGLVRMEKMGEKYTSGPRYWNVPVLVNTGTFLVYQYCPKMWYLRSLEHASVIQKRTILEHKNGLVLSNTRVPVSGTWSLLFPPGESRLKNPLEVQANPSRYRWMIQFGDWPK